MTDWTATPLEDRIGVHDDIIPRELLDALNDLFALTGWRPDVHSNVQVPQNSHWRIDFSPEVRLNRNDVTDALHPLVKEIWQIVQKRLMPEHEIPLRVYANAHYYGNDGSPHKDSEFVEDQTVIIYMMPEWDPRLWGGETMIWSGDELVAAVAPKYGRCVSFPGVMWHGGRAPTRICQSLRKVMVFKARPRNETDA